MSAFGGHIFLRGFAPNGQDYKKIELGGEEGLRKINNNNIMKNVMNCIPANYVFSMKLLQVTIGY